MNYEQGLERLKQLVYNTNQYQEFLLYEQRLLETLNEERLYGTNEQRRSDRAQVIAQLNHLAAYVNTNFNDLCKSKNIPNRQTPSKGVGKQASSQRTKPRKNPVFLIGPLSFSIVLVALVGLVVAVVISRSLLVPPSSTSEQVLIDPSSTPVLNDPMAHNSQSQWSVGQHCTFTNGVYRLYSVGGKFCIAQAQTFTDFHYQIQMTILKGSVAGVIFRCDGNDKYYYFYIDRLHSKYEVYLVSQASNSSVPPTPLRSGSVQDLKPTNELDVFAQGPHIKLYINRLLVAQVQNSSLSSGYIGVCVDTDTIDPDQNIVNIATFKNAKVWGL